MHSDLRLGEVGPLRLDDLVGSIATFRHGVNNQLALVVAAAELMRRRPEMAESLAAGLIDQCEAIGAEVRRFTTGVEGALQALNDEVREAGEKGRGSGA